MKPVMQTRIGDDPDAPGNCFTACIATIFEVDLSELPDEAKIVEELKAEGEWGTVPRFNRNRAWSRFYQAIQTWLFSRFGLRMIELNFKGMCRPPLDGIVAIANGKSPRGIEHSVVSIGGELVHDPHPEGGDISEEDRHYTLFVKGIVDSRR